MRTVTAVVAVLWAGLPSSTAFAAEGRGGQSLRRELRQSGLAGLLREAQRKGPRHVYFAGQPGSGRLAKARLYATALKKQGLAKGKIVEIRGGDLRGLLWDEGASMIRRNIELARGGVVIVNNVDELHTTRSAAAALLKAAGENHLVVLWTGSAKKMRAMKQTDSSESLFLDH